MQARARACIWIMHGRNLIFYETTGTCSPAGGKKTFYSPANIPRVYFVKYTIRRGANATTGAGGERGINTRVQPACSGEGRYSGHNVSAAITKGSTPVLLITLMINIRYRDASRDKSANGKE